MSKQIISAAFPFESKFIPVNGSNIHYIEEGRGDPVLFLCGPPASVYLWRNIIPGVSKHARCIAPDLIGLGKSDKPDIAYHISDHIKYIEGFIDALKLRNITLVVHGLGSIIGFNYAMQHPDNIKGVVFYESYIGELNDWKKFSLPMQQITSLLQTETNQQAILSDKNLITKIFNSASLRRLTKEELQIYNNPFQKLEDRKPLYQYIKESPYSRNNQEVVQLISKYTSFLKKAAFPKLMIFTIPGFVTTVSTVEWCRQHLSNLTLVDLGEGLHFVQEYNPQEFTDAIVNWYTQLPQEKISTKVREEREVAEEV